MTSSFRVAPGGRLSGSLRVPGDKSISHRSIMLGAIADGTTEVSGFLEGADAISTMNVFRALGVAMEGPTAGRVTVRGVGLDGLRGAAQPLDCGNAGTAMRLLMGLLAGQPFESTLIGDASLSKRPMRRVADPLTAMGARIETRDGCPPVRILPSGGLHGIRYPMPMASAQLKSALLLAGLYASGETVVVEPAPTRDHTERMLGGFGVRVERDGAQASVRGGQRLRATSIDVPADISSAAFFLVGASIAEGSDITLEHVGMNPTRTGIIDILRLMGANIEVLASREVGGEPVADLRVRAAPLRGIEVPRELVPLAIDEFPALFIAAACAEGRTVVSGAEELRVKESDRIAVMADGLQTLGVSATPTPDGMIIDGRGGQPQVFGAGAIESHGDHRISMSFAMAALRAGGALEIRDTANVGTSFPGFTTLAARAGLAIDVGAADPLRARS
ncbi:MAG: 3-phosphoshikimate 1-carboxyvinyltransferase [Burkholderiales bacterium]|nr:3-phosphoshikimate 1-carboxyvinyltransferase [Burkholderiales bacterium]